MALPTVKINNSTGSNTAASGAGPSTALFGTAAATAASAVITLLVDNPDLSGVSTTGSDVIYVGSSSGRKFGKITALDNTVGVKTVSCDTSYANTESGKNWGIGGKRLDFETTNAHTKQLFTDCTAGWIVDIEQTGISYVLTSTITVGCVGDKTTGRVVIKSSSATRPLITCATNSIQLWSFSNAASPAYVEWNHLSMSHTAGTRAGAFTRTAGSAAPLWFIDCIFDGFLGFFGTNTNITSNTWIGCELKNFTSSTAALNPTTGLVICYGCDIHDNAGDGIRHGANSTVDCEDTIFDTNAGCGFQDNGGATNSMGMRFSHCTFVDNTLDGIKSTTARTSGNLDGLKLSNNLFWGNGGADINIATTALAVDTAANYNYYSASGNNANPRAGLSAGTGDVALSATDPFTSRSGRDFTPNNTAGGGLLIQGTAFPTTWPGATTTNHMDIGAVQHADPASGGGLIRHPGMAGGLNA